MKKLIVAVLAAMAVAATAGCAAGSGAIDMKEARKVKAGMSKEEVVSIMGKPYSIQSLGDGKLKYVWVHVVPFGGASSAVMTFKDGKAIDSFHVPDDF